MESILKFNSDEIKRHGIVLGKKKPILAIVFLAISLALFVYSLTLGNDMANISASIKVAAFSLAVTGVVMLFFRNISLKDATTGEELGKRVYFFENEQEANVKKAALNGEFETLAKKSSKNSTLPLMLVVYITPSQNCAIYQIFKYIPHSYEPIADIQYFNRNNTIKTEKDGVVFNTVDSGANLADCGS